MEARMNLWDDTPERIAVGLLGEERTILYLMAEVLTRGGFEVTEIGGHDRLEALREAKTADVIVWDETGMEQEEHWMAQLLCHEAIVGELPVVLLTDCDDPAYMGGCLERGFEDVLIKPFRVGELCARVRKAGRSRPGAQATKPTTIELQGQLSQMGLPDVLFHLHQSRSTGVLEVGCLRQVYVIVLEEGELQAVFGPGELRGRKALFRALASAQGGFRYRSGRQDVEGGDDLRGLAQLVLTGVQQADEYREILRELPGGTLLLSVDGLEALGQVPEILEPLMASRVTGTVEELIDASARTDLEAALALKTLFDGQILFAAEEAVECEGLAL
jgi:DNA-binding response OmpR family regulator